MSILDKQIKEIKDDLHCPKCGHSMAKKIDQLLRFGFITYLTIGIAIGTIAHYFYQRF